MKTLPLFINTHPLAQVRKTPHWKIRHAAHVLQQGGLLAYPTEAVFGLGCLPNNLVAIKNLLHVKQRPMHKGLILLASNIEQLAPYLGELKPSIVEKILGKYPQPTTWVLPASKHISPLIRGDFPSIAIRLSDHPIVKELCTQCQSAIISTSANITGKQMTYSAFAVRLQFNNKLDYILNGPLGTSDKPSVIKDVITGQIIRH